MIEVLKIKEALKPSLQIFQFFCFGHFQITKRSSFREKVAAGWILIKYAIVAGILLYLSFNGKTKKLRRGTALIQIVDIFAIGTIIRSFVSVFQVTLIFNILKTDFISIF